MRIIRNGRGGVVEKKTVKCKMDGEPGAETEDDPPHNHHTSIKFYSEYIKMMLSTWRSFRS